MLCLSNFGLLLVILFSVLLVDAAPSTQFQEGQISSALKHRTSIPFHRAQYKSFLSEGRLGVRRRSNRIVSRRLTNSQVIIEPKYKSSRLEFSISLLDAARALHTYTGVIYSSIVGLNQKVYRVAPDQLEDAIVFQLTEWYKYAELVSFLGNIGEKINSELGSNEMITLQSNLENAIILLKQTLFEVDSILNEMPSIRYILGPMVYNIHTSINKYQDHLNLSSSISDCFGLESIKQFC